MKPRSDAPNLLPIPKDLGPLIQTLPWLAESRNYNQSKLDKLAKKHDLPSEAIQAHVELLHMVEIARALKTHEENHRGAIEQNAPQGPME